MEAELGKEECGDGHASERSHGGCIQMWSKEGKGRAESKGEKPCDVWRWETWTHVQGTETRYL